MDRQLIATYKLLDTGTSVQCVKKAIHTKQSTPHGIVYMQ